MTFEEFDEAVGIAAAELPDELFKGLSGGVIALPEAKLHKSSLPEAPLYIEGQYVRSALGKQVILYYGSFEKLYPYRTDAFINSQIRFVLRHELRHHWEGLAGERALEEEDEDRIEQYLERHRNDMR